MDSEAKFQLAEILGRIGDAANSGKLKSIALVANDGKEYMRFVMSADSIKLVGEVYILLSLVENWHNERHD